MLKLKSFGEALVHFRKRAGLTQKGLAESAGIDATYLSRLETSKRIPPKRENIMLLAETLHLAVDERDWLLTQAGYSPEYSSPLQDSDAHLKSIWRVSTPEAQQLAFEVTKALIPLVDDRRLPETHGAMLALISSLPEWLSSMDQSLRDYEQKNLEGTLGQILKRAATTRTELEDKNLFEQQNALIDADAFLSIGD